MRLTLGLPTLRPLRLNDAVLLNEMLLFKALIVTLQSHYAMQSTQEQKLALASQQALTLLNNHTQMRKDSILKREKEPQMQKNGTSVLKSQNLCWVGGRTCVIRGGGWEVEIGGGSKLEL